jgi:hypothetical protein
LVLGLAGGLGLWVGCCGFVRGYGGGGLRGLVFVDILVLEFIDGFNAETGW